MKIQSGKIPETTPPSSESVKAELGVPMTLLPFLSLMNANAGALVTGIEAFLIDEESTQTFLSDLFIFIFLTRTGSDIMMQLDDVVSSTVTGPRVEEAMRRSVRWLDRCIAANKNPHRQNLFAIIQGGLNAELRRTCLEGERCPRLCFSPNVQSQQTREEQPSGFLFF